MDRRELQCCESEHRKRKKVKADKNVVRGDSAGTLLGLDVLGPCPRMAAFCYLTEARSSLFMDQWVTVIKRIRLIEVLL